MHHSTAHSGIVRGCRTATGGLWRRASEVAGAMGAHRSEALAAFRHVTGCIVGVCNLLFRPSYSMHLIGGALQVGHDRACLVPYASRVGRTAGVCGSSVQFGDRRSSDSVSPQECAYFGLAAQG